MEFYIAGAQYKKGVDYVDDMRVGMILQLIPEPFHVKDPNAVKIEYDGHAITLGYVPKKFNVQVRSLLAGDEKIECSLIKVDPKADPWKMFKVRVGKPETKQMNFDL